MRKYSCDLYAPRSGDRAVGRLQAHRFHRGREQSDRLEEYRRVSAFNRFHGIDVHEISPKLIKDLFPLAHVDDLLAGFYVKEDGRADPVGVTMALAKGARQQGARLIENVAVTGLVKERGVVKGVTTPYGNIEAEYVVNCAGMWARRWATRPG
jgi:4-methylaminobutanoate oxidase (formaldehyde-forming)